MNAARGHPRTHPAPRVQPSVRVRPAVRADLDALVALEEAAFVGDRATRRALRHAVDAPTMSLLVAAEDDGSVAAAATLERRRGARAARLTSIAVRPERAGGGLGRALLAAAEGEAAVRGFRAVRLEVRGDNEPAIRLYERAGYRRFAVVPAYYEDGQEAWRFEKVLAPPADG